MRKSQDKNIVTGYRLLEDFVKKGPTDSDFIDKKIAFFRREGSNWFEVRRDLHDLLERKPSKTLPEVSRLIADLRALAMEPSGQPSVVKFRNAMLALLEGQSDTSDDSDIFPTYLRVRKSKEKHPLLIESLPQQLAFLRETDQTAVGLAKNICENPQDAAPYFILADRLDELGKENSAVYMREYANFIVSFEGQYNKQCAVFLSLKDVNGKPLVREVTSANGVKRLEFTSKDSNGEDVETFMLPTYKEIAAGLLCEIRNLNVSVLSRQGLNKLRIIPLLPIDDLYSNIIREIAVRRGNAAESTKDSLTQLKATNLQGETRLLTENEIAVSEPFVALSGIHKQNLRFEPTLDGEHGTFVRGSGLSFAQFQQKYKGWKIEMQLGLPFLPSLKDDPSSEIFAGCENLLHGGNHPEHYIQLLSGTRKKGIRSPAYEGQKSYLYDPADYANQSPWGLHEFYMDVLTGLHEDGHLILCQFRDWNGLTIRQLKGYWLLGVDIENENNNNMAVQMYWSPSNKRMAYNTITLNVSDRNHDDFSCPRMYTITPQLNHTAQKKVA